MTNSHHLNSYGKLWQLVNVIKTYKHTIAWRCHTSRKRVEIQETAIVWAMRGNGRCCRNGESSRRKRMRWLDWCIDYTEWDFKEKFCYVNYQCIKNINTTLQTWNWNLIMVLREWIDTQIYKIKMFLNIPDPWPTTDLTPISPPWSSTRPLEIFNPRPVIYDIVEPIVTWLLILKQTLKRS